jgi:hypothetical protein
MGRQTLARFPIAGAVAGIVAALLGKVWPISLVFDGGILFVAAVLSAIASMDTNSFRFARGRFSALTIVGAALYVVVVFTLVSVTHFAWHTLGLQRSDDMLELGGDIVTGFFAAILVTCLGFWCLGAILPKRRSHAWGWNLLAAGFAVFATTFIFTRLFHSYWSFIGVALVSGNVLFCWALGREIESLLEDSEFMEKL